MLFSYHFCPAWRKAERADTAEASVRLRTAREQLRQFARQTGLNLDSSRIGVSGFGRSQASRASALAARLAADISKVSRYSSTQYQAMLQNAARQQISATCSRLPLEGNADSIAELIREDGTVKQRRVYGSDGKALIDYDTDDHGKPKWHPTGAHKHEYSYSRKNPRGPACSLTEYDLKYNQDIIREGENYHAPTTESSD